MNTDILRGQRLLILEDDPATCRLFEALFAEVCAVDIVTTPEEALERAAREKYDVAVIDINLKRERLNGLAVLRRIRAMEATGDLPVLAATAYALPGDKERFLEEGFDGYIAKPFTRASLFEPIIHLLKRRRSDREK